MTKEEELRQLEELRRIRAEERAKMHIQDNSYLEDSAFAPDNSYLNDSAFTDSAFVDSAFAPTNNQTNHNYNNQRVQNPVNTGYVNQNIQNPVNTGYNNPNMQKPMNTGYNNQNVQNPVNTGYNNPNMQKPMNTGYNNQNVQNPVNTGYNNPNMQKPMNTGYNNQNMQKPMNTGYNNQNMQKSMNNGYSNRNTQQRRSTMTDRNNNALYNNDLPSDQYDRTNVKADKKKNTPNKNNTVNNRKKRKKKHPFLKFVAILLILVLCVCGLGIGMAVHALNKMDRIETNVSKRGDNFQGDIINILLIGQDAREGQEAQRADTIILLTINKNTHTATLTSIMRDMYVPIPGYGSNKINAAYAYGGMDLLDQTIEENFGIRIDGNAMVDFSGFLEAMTAVGDLDIELTAEEAEYLNQNTIYGTADDVAVETWNLHEGVNTLTPSQLLAYSRIRHVGNSDWDRTNRQRTVIMSTVDKVKHGHLIKGIKVVNGAAPHITTDISTMNILKTGFAYLGNSKGGMQSYYLPAEGTYSAQYVNGMAVLMPDIEANRQILQQYMQGVDPAEN